MVLEVSESHVIWSGLLDSPPEFNGYVLSLVLRAGYIGSVDGFVEIELRAIVIVVLRSKGGSRRILARGSSIYKTLILVAYFTED